jgi:hypothetical protein
MQLIVHLKLSSKILELSRLCDCSPRDASATGFVETARSMRCAVEEHVLACQEMVKRGVPRGTRVDALPGMHVLLVNCEDGDVGQMRPCIEAACEHVLDVAEDVQLKALA